MNEDDLAGVTFDVLANDSDPDGDTVSLGSFDGSTIANGVLTDNGGGSFTYVPDPAFFGSETFTYTASDGTGASAPGTVTITIVPQPDNPVAGADSYVTNQATLLTVPAPGLLGNDYDEDGDGLTVAPTLVAGAAERDRRPPAGRFVRLHAKPALRRDGHVHLPHRRRDGPHRRRHRRDHRELDGHVVGSVPAVRRPVRRRLGHLDGRSPGSLTRARLRQRRRPGLTIKSSGGSENENDPAKYQIWRYVLATPLQLNGPVALQLWSTSKDFRTDKDAHPHLYLYDCAAGGTACTKIAETDVHFRDWNGSTANWVYHEITIGSVNRSIAAGRELRIRLLVHHEDVWVAMTAAYPSALQITTG